MSWNDSTQIQTQVNAHYHSLKDQPSQGQRTRRRGHADHRATVTTTTATTAFVAATRGRRKEILGARTLKGSAATRAGFRLHVGAVEVDGLAAFDARANLALVAGDAIKVQAVEYDE